MGKASRWFRSLLNLKPKQSTTEKENNNKPTRRWSFGKSYRQKDTAILTSKQTPISANSATSSNTNYYRVDLEVDDEEENDQNQRAVAVAAATAAVADAAVAAAQGRRGGGQADVVEGYLNLGFIVVEIQKGGTVNGVLFHAKKALRALRGLVRLQAIVRGHIDRKQTATWMKQLQACARAQARARVGRSQNSESSQSSSKEINLLVAVDDFQPKYYVDSEIYLVLLVVNLSSRLKNRPTNPEKIEHRSRSRSVKYEQPLSMLKRNMSKSRGRAVQDQDKVQSGCNWLDEQSRDLRSVGFGLPDDDETDKILEIDVVNMFHSTPLTHGFDQYNNRWSTSKDSGGRKTDFSSYSCEVDFVKPLKFSNVVDESPFCTADNSPQFYSASSSRRSPFTPTKSDGFLSGYSDHPNYMSYTQSSRAKVRSISAPKQRPQYERSFSTKRSSVYGFGESRANAHRISALHSNFTNKAYPGSGRLDRMGMSMGYRF
ncbi:protein IQ-DOMAIN 22-like [Rutidosis leptorrhynchoides]|uniref:protein IQ-DOMAIN 22-like n=1 Tax=Rutidosis leptorrhynchoides TaxID=125765 RepID=UPI003A99263B